MGELEKLEVEETVKVEGANRSLGEDFSIAIYEFIDIGGRHHSSFQEAGE